MRNKNFGDFVNKKKRETIKQLQTLKNVLEQSGMKVENFLNPDKNEDPYIYCVSPTKNGSFDGIRIYKIGNIIAFRIQKESKTHPYGSAYSLPIEEMFNDFLSDEGSSQEEAGKKVIESVVKEIVKFFDKSLQAESEERKNQIEDEQSNGSVAIRGTGGTDYSSLVYNRN